MFEVNWGMAVLVGFTSEELVQSKPFMGLPDRQDLRREVELMESGYCGTRFTFSKDYLGDGA